MSINPNCPNRIRPKLLREIKTEALLVFIRTTLEQSFDQIDTKGYQFLIGSNEDSDYVYSILRKLLKQLQECVINSTYLRSVIANSDKNQFFKILAKKEEPLMQYYDSIIKGIEINLLNGTSWIPELVVISMLSEWIVEEEKSVYLYPFLADIDYLDLIDRYDKSKTTLDEDKKEVIMNMYRISSDIISRLKKSTYKVNHHRKSKRKKLK